MKVVRSSRRPQPRSRPAIPREVARAVLIEAGHRCAVCGAPCPLERAHIVPWSRRKSHREEDLICLCANCHQRADIERCGENTLREYKVKPWVHRQGNAPVIALGAAAAALLARLDRCEGNPYVCWGNSPDGHFIGLHHVWQRIRRRAQLPEVRVHDMRHSFASFGAAAGLGLPVLGALLGHKQPVTTARYAHLANNPLRAAADRITSEIAAALDGRPLAEVLPIRGGAEPGRR